MIIRGQKAKYIQQHLTDNGFNVGSIDGVIGNNTRAAINNALTQQAQLLSSNLNTFSNNRKLIAYIQLMCKEQNIEVGKIDGFWGPQTDYAFNIYVFQLEYASPPDPWRDTAPNNTNPNNWPQQTQSSLRAFYGDVATNQVLLDLPYPHKLAWDKSTIINRFSCHEKVSDSIHRVLTNVHNHYGIQKIKELRLDLWGGCFNNRNKRGGTSKSTHAWGIALDYDPSHNRFGWGRSRAQFVLPEYDKWWEFWEQEGWVSLGRSANFDWMHIQAAKID